MGLKVHLKAYKTTRSCNYAYSTTKELQLLQTSSLDPCRGLSLGPISFPDLLNFGHLRCKYTVPSMLELQHIFFITFTFISNRF